MRYEDAIAPKTRVSRRFYEAVKLSDRHAVDLAHDSGLDSSTLSLILNGRRGVRLNDPRIVRLGKLVGLKPADIFEPVNKQDVTR